VSKRIQEKALGLCLAMLAALAGTEAGLVENPGLETEAPFTWRCDGKVERSQEVPHSGRWCLYVRDDRKDLLCQAANAYFPAALECYYAEAWLRIDPGFPDSTATLNAQFFDAAHQYLGRERVGVTRSAEWTRVSTLLTLPEDAVRVRLSILATDWKPLLEGACFVDDLYFAPAKTAVRQGKLPVKRKPCLNDDPSSPGGIRTAGGERPPDLIGKRLTPEAQVGFEDLSGWTLEAWGDVSAAFCRSR